MTSIIVYKSVQAAAGTQHKIKYRYIQLFYLYTYAHVLTWIKWFCMLTTSDACAHHLVLSFANLWKTVWFTTLHSTIVFTDVTSIYIYIYMSEWCQRLNGIFQSYSDSMHILHDIYMYIWDVIVYTLTFLTLNTHILLVICDNSVIQVAVSNACLWANAYYTVNVY